MVVLILVDHRHVAGARRVCVRHAWGYEDAHDKSDDERTCCHWIASSAKRSSDGSFVIPKRLGSLKVDEQLCDSRSLA